MNILSDIEEVLTDIPNVKLYQSGPLSNGYKMVRGSVNFDLEVRRASEGSLPEHVQRSTNFSDKAKQSKCIRCSNWISKCTFRNDRIAQSCCDKAFEVFSHVTVP
jgi:hypothetical protein